MPHRVRLVLLAHMAALLLLLLGCPNRAGRVRKKAPRSRSCLDQPEEMLEQMFGRLSVGVMSAFHHALQLEPRDKLNLSCPKPEGPLGARRSRPPLNLLSISPWAYRLSYEPSRYPRYIPEAYCLCEGCLLGPRGEESRRLRSTPVYAPSVILRRTGSCVGGRHTYTEMYVSVAVGCTCVPLQEEDRDPRSDPRSDSRSPGRAAPRAGGRSKVRKV